MTCVRGEKEFETIVRGYAMWNMQYLLPYSKFLRCASRLLPPCSPVGGHPSSSATTVSRAVAAATKSSAEPYAAITLEEEEEEEEVLLLKSLAQQYGVHWAPVDSSNNEAGATQLVYFAFTSPSASYDGASARRSVVVQHTVRGSERDLLLLLLALERARFGEREDSVDDIVDAFQWAFERFTIERWDASGGATDQMLRDLRLTREAHAMVDSRSRVAWVGIGGPEGDVDHMTMRDALCRALVLRR